MIGSMNDVSAQIKALNGQHNSTNSTAKPIGHRHEPFITIVDPTYLVSWHDSFEAGHGTARRGHHRGMLHQATLKARSREAVRQASLCLPSSICRPHRYMSRIGRASMRLQGWYEVHGKFMERIRCQHSSCGRLMGTTQLQ